jgi:DNA-binding MarR family transcriptional regulator
LNGPPRAHTLPPIPEGTDVTKDLVDQLIEDWSKERPDLDARPMACVGRILRLASALEARANAAIRSSGLCYTDFDVLATLRRSGPPFRLAPTTLRNAVLITSGAMTAALNRLEKAALIRRSQDAADGRVRWVTLTPRGRTLVDRAVELRFTEASEAVAGLTAQDRAALSALLKKLASGLAARPPASG